MISKITILNIPHELQDYETVGNWLMYESSLDITVSDMENEDCFFLVAIHELIEAWLCRKRGIKEEDVSAFDKEFEANRKEGNTDEPGDDPKAPYNREHLFATGIEQILASELGVIWKDYDKAVNEL